MQDSFVGKVARFGTFEMIDLTRCKRSLVIVKIQVHEPTPLKMNIVTDVLKGLDAVRFVCKSEMNGTVEFRFIDTSGGFTPIDLFHPVVKSLLKGIAAKVTPVHRNLIGNRVPLL